MAERDKIRAPPPVAAKPSHLASQRGHEVPGDRAPQPQSTIGAVKVRDTGPVKFEDIPGEVILGHVVPALSCIDLLNLSRTSKRLRSLANDDKAWRRLILRDFKIPHLPRLLDAKLMPHKKFYAGLKYPKLFLWGAMNERRLGMYAPDSPRIPRPSAFIGKPQELNTGLFDRETVREKLAALDIMGDSGGAERETDALARHPGTKITLQVALGITGDASGSGGEKDAMARDLGSVISLQAGFTSSAALTSTGKVIVWGRLDPMYYVQHDPRWRDKFLVMRDAEILPLPCKAVAMSFTNKHITVLDSDNLVWDILSYKRAYQHASPLLCAPFTPGNKGDPPYIIQVVAGTYASACLTNDGNIVTWNPFAPEFRDRIDVSAPTEPNIAQRPLVCETIKDCDHVMLPPLPARGQASFWWDKDGSGRADHEALWRGREVIADAEKVIEIGVRGATVVARKRNGEIWEHNHGWKYISRPSRPDVRGFCAHAGMINCVSYTSDTVLSSWSDADASTAKVIPDSGPNDQLVKVVRAPSHYMVLTAKGQLLAWGESNRSGYIGVGGRDPVDEPTMIEFPIDNAIVFDITGAYGHSGALVLGDVDVGESRTGSDRIAEAFEVLRLRGGATEDDAEGNDEGNGQGADASHTGQNPPSDRREQTWLQNPTGPNMPDGRTGPTATNFSGPADGSPGTNSAPGGNGNHPQAAGGLDAPAFRIGFAGRHALPHGTRGPPADDTGESDNAGGGGTGGVGNHPQAGPGGATFRIGFAGRGQGRGRGGSGQGAE